MESKHLIWFQEVCRCRSITKAAANLFVTPQGLSKSIKSVEAELGVRLLERTPNGILLTPYGEILLAHSGRLLAAHQDMLSEIETLKQQERGLIRVCSSYGVIRILGMDFILDFDKERPDMSLDYMEFPDEYVEKEIQEERFDAGLAISPVRDPELEVIPILRSPVSLLVYEGHPLAEQETVRFADLKNEPMILESKAFKIYSLVKDSCRKAGFEPEIIFCTSGFSLCHKLVAQKRGVSVIVDRISADMPRKDLSVIPIADGFSWEANLVYKKKYAHHRNIRDWKDYTCGYIQKNHRND